MKWSKLINGVIAAFILSSVLSSVSVYVSETLAIFSFFLGIVGFSYWNYNSDYTKRIWARTLAGLAVLFFIWPITILIFGAKETLKTTNAAEGVGTAIGSGLAAGIVGFFGFLLGIALLVVSFLLYREIPKK